MNYILETSPLRVQSAIQQLYDQREFQIISDFVVMAQPSVFSMDLVVDLILKQAVTKETIASYIKHGVRWFCEHETEPKLITCFCVFVTGLCWKQMVDEGVGNLRRLIGRVFMIT